MCGEPFYATETQIYHIDHKQRKASGGGEGMENLQALHPWCHELKTALENQKPDSVETADTEEGNLAE